MPQPALRSEKTLLNYPIKSTIVLQIGILIVRKLRINIDLFKRDLQGLLHNLIKIVP